MSDHRSVMPASLAEVLALLVALVTVAGVAAWVDLRPAVQQEFFFADDDPQVATLREIDGRFPPTPQVVVRVSGEDVDGPAHRAVVDSISAALLEIPQVSAAYSVASEDPDSPLWSRLLTVPDGTASNIVLQVDGSDPEALVEEIDAVLSGAPEADGDVEASGVPVIVERIRRSLFRDLVVFSVGAALVFAVLAALVYRRLRIVVGTLASCVTACGVTLAVAQAGGLRIGLLTANIVTIVFVLTLSHIVFLTGNFGRALASSDGHAGPDDDGEAGDTAGTAGSVAARSVAAGTAGAVAAGSDAARTAVRWTRAPSFWCMVTTFLGFSSLLLASARPLRELGMAGALGTVVAFAAAFTLYPPFLAGVASVAAGGTLSMPVGRWLPRSRGRWWLAGSVLVVLVLGAGVARVDTDPGLLSYFEEGSDLRRGLELVDRDGGSSILKVVVRDVGGAPLDEQEVYDRLWEFQDALEEDPAVGVVVSPAVLVAHARSQPLAGFLPLGLLFDVLDSGLANEIGPAFVASDRSDGLYLLRMREAGRETSRRAVLDRVRTHARGAGLEPALVGGLYDLQAALGELIADSLRLGLAGLGVLFLLVAAWVSRSVATSAAMLGCLAAVPLVVLGAFGHLGIAVDIVTSPAANVALAMGVDSMIHLVARVRGLEPDVPGPERWWRARRDLAGPVSAAALMISVGFGIFALSDFPPTRRFGFAVIVGTATAAYMTLVVLPFAARLAERVRPARS